MDENNKLTFSQKLKKLLSFKTLLRYLALVLLLLYGMSGLFYLQGQQGATAKYRDTRDRFYENTADVNARDDIFSSYFYAELVTIFLIFPILFIVDIVARRKFLSSFFVFPVLFIIFIIITSIINSLFSKMFLGPPISNKDIVKLEKVWIETVDSNGNNKPDTLKTYLTLNGSDPRNKSKGGLFAFGGVKICIYSTENRFQPLTCEHFFHAENQDKLRQDRLRIGMSGSHTYLFSIETPLDANLTFYNSAKDLRITADFIGADAPLVFYSKEIKNTIDFQNFENIGIYKLPNEKGLH